jgi:hypothetical protein
MGNVGHSNKAIPDNPGLHHVWPGYAGKNLQGKRFGYLQINCHVITGLPDVLQWLVQNVMSGEN